MYYFLFDEVNRWDEIDWLIQVGLINNGRCMLCGKPLTKKAHYYRPPGGLKHVYEICDKCAAKNKSRSSTLCPKCAENAQLGIGGADGQCSMMVNGYCCGNSNKAASKSGKRDKSEFFLTVIVALVVLSYVIYLIVKN